MKKGNLDQIGVKYGTDKSSLLHDYLNQYEKYFGDPSKIETVVELGLQRQSGEWKNYSLPSVRMWLEYFPNAEVFGFDKQQIKPMHRFHFFNGDQGRIFHLMQFKNMLGGRYIDILVDDCSHRPTHQLLSFIYFWPYIRSGGIYVIEDTKPIIRRQYESKYWIENVIDPYLGDDVKKTVWIDSKSSGEKSSLLIIKK